MSETRSKSEEFMLMQYEALRKEILEIKERLIRMQTVGITAIPLIIGAGMRFDLDATMLVSPMITLAFTFMVVFEQNSLMRAGAYIKQKIERRIFNSNIPDDIGWEAWLEQSQKHQKKRGAENFFAWSVHIVFAVYFMLSSYFSWDVASKMTNNTFIVNALPGVYFAFFILAFYVVYQSLPRGTTDFDDQSSDLTKSSTCPLIKDYIDQQRKDYNNAPPA